MQCAKLNKVCLSNIKSLNLRRGFFLGGREKVFIVIIIVFLVGGVIFNLYQRNTFKAFEADPVDTLNEGGESIEEGVQEELLTVHIVGGVKVPGIYNLPVGSRVHDVVEEAGGVTGEADTERINMARPLFDGEQIIVPVKTENGPGEGLSSEQSEVTGINGGGKININRASASELTALSGIGESRAKNIITYREENGPFKTIEDIMNVPNIGTGIFSGIKEDITVY